MKKVTMFVLTMVMLLLLCACGNNEQTIVETTAIKRDDPLVVAEKALSYLLDDRDVDAFMTLCPYYESSGLYQLVKEQAEICVNEARDRETFRNVGLYADLSSREAEAYIEAFESDGIEGVKNLRVYDFTNEFADGDFENLDILVGRIGSEWHVFAIDFQS